MHLLTGAFYRRTVTESDCSHVRPNDSNYSLMARIRERQGVGNLSEQRSSPGRYPGMRQGRDLGPKFSNLNRVPTGFFKIKFKSF